MLNVVGLRAAYGDVEVVHGISFSVDSGEIVTIIGANGAGKTTTLRALCGVQRNVSGTIMFDGVNICRREPFDIVAAGISMVPEGRQLFGNFTVLDNLLMGAYKRSARRDVRRRLRGVLEIFPRLRARISQRAATLSGGEQQMVAIGRGLMAEPVLLALDEPSVGLSPLLVAEMFDTIHKIRDSGTAILVIEQNVHQTLQIADRGYVLENGRIVKDGSSEQLLHDPDVLRAYLGVRHERIRQQ